MEIPGGSAGPTQAVALDRWPDGSIRWALVEFAADADAGRVPEYALQFGPHKLAAADTGLKVVATPATVDVSTGRATFVFAVGGAFPFSSVTVAGRQLLDAGRSGLRIEHDGQTFECAMSSVQVRTAGPLRAEIEIGATVGSAGKPLLDVFAKVEIFAGSATARLEITVRNPRRAKHPSGQWVLGDEGSVLLRSVALVTTLGDEPRRVRYAAETGAALSDARVPFEIYQDSSGGDHWNGPVHRNRDGRVPVRFRGYRLKSGGEELSANRASPVVVIDTDGGQVSVALPQFWENFPRAIAVDGSTIEVGLFPRQADDLYELQGGEQKTHTVVVAFAADTVSDPPLAWSHDPLLLYPSPEWCCGTGAVPFLVPAAEDPNAGYLQLVANALDPVDGFLQKRERADEFGWRNFGDLPADHESAFQPAGETPFVSHYNNQYDAIAGFAIHFLRTGDPRWWRLMNDLARHVRDIDIYHTTEDKAAYNGGLFWHTYHYVDAGTSTHRTYPRGRPESGGPSAEHNYNTGLMWHYFMTGDRGSRDAAIGLARWVVDMDDGRLTPFRWLAGGATGLASSTGSMSYHGPGRGPANSLIACLVAHRLTGDAVYAAKADEIILRCVHPDDDLAALNLLDVERRWFYTVFLQALGVYLDQKHAQRAPDEMSGYAHASLLHYARWMADHERPYLDHPEILEHRTETWAAQDMRKAEVFLWAAGVTEGAARATFLERAEFFFRYSVDTLGAMPGRRFTRPIVLMLSNGVRFGWLKTRTSEPPVAKFPAPSSGQAKQGFEPQRARAIRRAKWVVLAGVATAIIAVALIIMRA